LERAVTEYCHTGKIVTKDHVRAEMVLTHYLQTGSLRATARHMGCSPRSIHRMIECFAATGKLAALKERLSHKIGLILELGADDFAQRIEDGRLQLTSIDLGILIEKRLLLDGEATSITATRVEVDVRVEDVVGYLSSKGIAVPAIDVESTAIQQKSKEMAP